MASPSYGLPDWFQMLCHILNPFITPTCVVMQAAAQQLKVGVTTLKKICRTAQVTRWPFRKRTSIERLIHRTQYFMTDGDDLEQKIVELQCLLAQREGLKVGPNASHQQQVTIIFEVYLCLHSWGCKSIRRQTEGTSLLVCCCRCLHHHDSQTVQCFTVAINVTGTASSSWQQSITQGPFRSQGMLCTTAVFCLCGEPGVWCPLQACQAKDVDAPIKRFRQSMFKKVHLEEREKRKAAKARKAGRLAFLPYLHPVH